MTTRENQQTTAPQQRAPIRQTRRHSRRWLPWVGAIVLIAALLAGLWPQPVPAELAKVTSGKLRATINEEGKTRVKNRYTLSAPLPGLLRRIELKAGSPVQAGRILAVLDPLPPTLLDARARTSAEARRDSAQAALAKAQANLSFATNELRRFDQLFKDSAISTQELESVQLRAESATKDFQAAQSSLRQVEAELALFQSDAPGNTKPVEVKAPVSGAVLRIIEESARPVSAGTPLLELGDPADLEVVIDVLSRDGAAIAPGTPVELDQWGGPDVLLAQVRLVEPAAFTKVSALGVEEQRVNVIADLVTPPEQRKSLGDSYRVEARIITWQSDHTLKAPAGALFRHGPDWAAFTIENGRARLRKIKVGRTSGSETQILEGLREGETLILYPGNRIRDGERIRAIKL